MMPEIDRVREALDGFDQIRLAIAFGSIARGLATDTSDLDVGVLCDEAISRDLRSAMIEALALETGRPIDLIDLGLAGEPLLGEVLSKGVRVLSRDDSAYAELLRKHLFDATDFLPYRNRILEERRSRWTNS